MSWLEQAKRRKLESLVKEEIKDEDSDPMVDEPVVEVVKDKSHFSYGAVPDGNRGVKRSQLASFGFIGSDKLYSATCTGYISIIALDTMRTVEMQIRVGGSRIVASRLLPDNESIVSIGEDKTINVTNISTEESCSITNIRGLAGQHNFYTLEVCPHASAIVGMTSDGGLIKIVDMDKRTLVRTLQTNKKVNAIAFDHKEDIIYAGDDSGHLYAWNFVTGKLLDKVVDLALLSCTSISVNSEGMISLGSKSGFMRIRNVKDGIFGTVIKEFKNLRYICDSSASNDDYIVFASSGSKHQVKVLDINSKQVCSNFPVPSTNDKTTISNVKEVHFSDNGLFMGVGEISGAIKLFRKFTD